MMFTLRIIAYKSLINFVMLLINKHKLAAAARPIFGKISSNITPTINL